MRKNIYLIIGASGSGKTTLVSKLEKELKQIGFEDNLSVESFTTRPPRYEGEKGHIFVDECDFPRKDLVAYTKFDGYEYGATKNQIDKSLFYVVDINGAIDIKNNYKGKKKIKTIFLDVPEKIRKERMLKRDKFIAKVEQRLAFDRTIPWNSIKYDVVVKDTDNINNLLNYILCEESLPSSYEKVIYISHPYDNNPKNKIKVSQIISYLRHLYPNYLFISPIHAFGFLYHETEYIEGLSMCTYLFKYCDEMWVADNFKISKGCLKEIAIAKNINIPIKILNVGALYEQQKSKN